MRAGRENSRSIRGRRKRYPIWMSYIALAVLTAVALLLVAETRSGSATLVTRTGTIRVLAADTVAPDGHDHVHAHGFHGHSEDVYHAVLVADDGHFSFLSGKRRFPNNQRVRVSGTLANGELAAETVTTISSPAPSAIATDGTTNVLVMLAYWTSPDSVTPESAASQMFGDSNGWYRDNSYGLLGQTGAVTPWMKIDPPTDNQCYGDSDQTMTQAKASAQALGYDLSQFDNFVVYFPYDGGTGSDCSAYAGWAFVGAPGTWLNGYMDRRVSVHEQGHNYGLWHGHSLLCAGRIDESCQFSEYGDDYDAMGSSGYVGHFSASQKDKLGWMPGRVQDLTAGGSTTLAPYETDAVATVAAKVDASPDRSYWLEYRRPADFDANLPSTGTDGVMVTLKDPSGPLVHDDGASLLDVRPEDGLSVTSATLRAGESWLSDEGIRFSVGAVSATSATVTVDRPTLGTLTGVVRDSRGAPLPGAVVQLADASSPVTVSDTAGRYTLSGVPAGPHTVTARHICLDPHDSSIATGSGHEYARPHAGVGSGRSVQPGHSRLGSAHRRPSPSRVTTTRPPSRCRSPTRTSVSSTRPPTSRRTAPSTSWRRAPSTPTRPCPTPHPRTLRSTPSGTTSTSMQPRAS